MATSAYFNSSKMLLRLHEGPLGGHIDLYSLRLLREGHCRQSAWRCLRVVGDFSRWLAGKQLGLRDVDEGMVGQYQAFRVHHRCPFQSDQPALNRLLVVLREVGAIAQKAAVTLTPHEQIFEDFRQYLDRECGLAPATIIHHLPVVRRFLRETRVDGLGDFATLSRADVTGYVERHAQDWSAATAKSMCWTLRAFLRYLLCKGLSSLDLADCVPSVRHWRFSALPTYLSAKQVQQVLDGCDRRTPIGRRDYAILILLARLGLRANEVATLTLDNVDWRSGQMLIHGKGRQQTQMPLPPDVGAAIAAYLQDGRPASDSRRMFLRDLAPNVGFTTSGAVSVIARTALARAGVSGFAHQGAHLFRHSLATELLRSGATLTEIGQLLRHRNHDTTRLYAKVDIDGLRMLGLPWPEAAQ
jgi:site-specific recombinase XerD